MVRTIVRSKYTREERKDPNKRESPDIDGFFSKLAKYIPAEITAAFLAVDYLLTNANPPISGNWYWGVFAILIALTPIYLWVVSILEESKLDRLQLVFATVAFIIWAFALGGSFFAAIPWYNKALAQVAVVLATLIIPMADTIITRVKGY